MHRQIIMFPVEVLELILQEVRLLGWQSVKACSLASHDFHLVARQILFQEVALSLEPNPTSSSTLQSAEFLEFLSRDAQVASHVRGLSIDRKQASWAEDAPGDWQASADKLALLPPKLTRLRRLHIQSNFIADWTLKNDDLRNVIMQLCRLPLHTLDLSFMTLKQSEILSFAGIPKLSLCCIDILSSVTTSNRRRDRESSSSPLLAPNNPIRLQDLTITPRYSDNRLPQIWSIMKAAGNSLTSLKCYSSPFDACLLTILEEIELRMYPSLLSFAVCIPLTSDEPIAKLVSIFSQRGGDRTALPESMIKLIEICCDIDVYNFPSNDSVSTWNWAALDSILTSVMYESLERVKITVKRVIRSRTARARRYDILEEKVLALFSNHLPLASQRRIVGAWATAEVFK